MNKREFCGSRNGFMVNQYAMRSGKLTYKELLVLYKFIDQFIYIERECPEKFLDSEWFYFLGDSAYEWLGMTASMFSKAITSLKDKGFISIRNVQVQGHTRPKNYYKIEYDAITELENKCDIISPTETDEFNLETAPSNKLSKKENHREIFPKGKSKFSARENLEFPDVIANNNISITNITDNQKKVVIRKNCVSPPLNTKLKVQDPKLTVMEGRSIPAYRQLWYVWVKLAEAAGYTKTEASTKVQLFNSHISQMVKIYDYNLIEKAFEAWFLDDKFKVEREKAGLSFLSWFITAHERIIKYVQNKNKMGKVAQDSDVASSPSKPIHI